MNNNDSLVAHLGKCYTGAIYDVMRGMGFADQLLPNYLRPLNLKHKIAGAAFTVNGRIDSTVDKDTSLLRWCEMLSKTPSGQILICQPNDHTLAYMGELSAETLSYKGVKGCIVDGGCRDSDFIRKIDFPVYCSYFTPRDVVASWYAESFGETINIGGVSISNGDYVLADSDGIIIIPQQIVEEVVAQAEVVLNTENLVRKAILAGTDPVEAYLKYKKF